MVNPAKTWVLFTVLSLLALTLHAVTPEERKAEFAKPRGLSKSSLSGSSGNSNSSAPSAASPAVADVYTKIGESFSKEMEGLSKDFTKSLPKIEQETNYLEELNKASKTLESSGGTQATVSLLSQYTEAFIATLEELTQMQIEFEISKTFQKTNSSSNTEFSPKRLHTEPAPSRTPSSTNVRGLFPKELDSITSKAYNPPK